MTEKRQRSVRRSPKGETQRQRIVDAALELISESGYRRSTLSDLAARVGLTNAGVIHHFGSKEELFVQVLAQRDDLSAADSSSSADVLEILVDVVDKNRAVPGLSQLFNALLAEASDPEHPAHQFFILRTQNLVSRISDSIADRRPDWTPERCNAFAELVVATADGLQAHWLLDQSIDVRNRLEMLIEGICSEQRSSPTSGATQEPGPTHGSP